jgi:hypothetical protein
MKLSTVRPTTLDRSVVGDVAVDVASGLLRTDEKHAERPAAGGDIDKYVLWSRSYQVAPQRIRTTRAAT